MSLPSRKKTGRPRSALRIRGQARYPNGQTIYVLEGVGRCQRASGPVEEIRPGGRVFFEPGEHHWHGAAPDRFMLHVALVEVDDTGKSADWGDKVTDAEYNG